MTDSQFNVSPVGCVPSAAMRDLDNAGKQWALIRNGSRGPIVWGFYATERLARAAMRRAPGDSLMTPHQINRREQQRQVMERRAPLDRRARYDAAMVQQRRTEQMRQRIATAQQSALTARLVDWKCRYDAALAARATQA